MRPLFKILLSVLAVLLIALYIVLNPRPDRPTGALSQQNYRRGPHEISHQSIDWVDTSRPTAANGNYKGSNSREFKGRIWFPTDKEGGPFPLLIYSHGSRIPRIKPAMCPFSSIKCSRAASSRRTC